MTLGTVTTALASFFSSVIRNISDSEIIEESERSPRTDTSSAPPVTPRQNASRFTNNGIPNLSLARCVTLAKNDTTEVYYLNRTGSWTVRIHKNRRPDNCTRCGGDPHASSACKDKRYTTEELYEILRGGRFVTHFLNHKMMADNEKNPGEEKVGFLVTLS